MRGCASPDDVANSDDQTGCLFGEDIEQDRPDDPLCIFCDDSVVPPMPNTAAFPDQPKTLERKVSFFSSPMNSPEDEDRGKVPMVKIANTARSDINGKFAYVHAYYRTRERYAVTLLEGGNRHPALVYFGALSAEDVEHAKFGKEGHNDEAQDDPRDRNLNHTLFLPPTTVVHLEFLDVASLFLQYSALRFFGSLYLARRNAQVMGFLQNQILRLENVSMFLLFILPVSLAKMYGLSTSNLDLEPISAPTLSYMITALSGHQGECFTLALLIVGASTIARFLISEYRLLQKKAEAMVSYSPNQKDSAFSVMEMFEYRIDHYFSTSKWAKVVLLLSFTFMLIFTGAGALVIFMEDSSISNAVWISWTYVADPGTHADCSEAFFIRLISFTVTVGGMLIFALMIGIISDYIAEKFDGLKKGKSRIIDIEHTVMLGWNDKSLAIIQQIALANESEGGNTIVVLANDGKEDLEHILASALGNNENRLLLHGTEVIFRSGNPLLESELRRVSTHTARCVISLSLDALDPDEADATQVRQVMALKAFDGFNGSKCHVVVEVQDVDNEDLFPLVAPEFVEVVVTHDIIGRLMLQCARCPGLASVLEEMMGFEGSEFYFEEWPEFSGMPFYDITCRFDDAVPLGIKCAISGNVYINPDNDHVIKEGDKIIVLAEDNDSYKVNDGLYKINGTGKVPKVLRDKKSVEKIMFCGWRRDMADMIKQLDEYLEKGSELWLLNMVPVKERAQLLMDQGNKVRLELENTSIRNVVGNALIRRDLNTMRAVDDDGKLTGQTVTLDQFDSILIVADAAAIENGANMMSCDSRSLSSLLIIQDIQKKIYDKKKIKYPNTKVPCDPISEILDSRTKSLLSVANCKGYIMSNQIISSVIAQISEEKDINIVLREILTAEGNETHLRSVTRYVDLAEKDAMSFWDIALRARKLREVAIGFKPEGMTFKDAADLIINPPEKAEIRKWAPGDIIVTFSME